MLTIILLDQIMSWNTVVGSAGTDATVMASIRFTSALGTFHHQGQVTLERFNETGLFRLAVDGVEVLMGAHGRNVAGKKAKFTIALPSYADTGTSWSVYLLKSKSKKNAAKKSVDICIKFPPLNCVGLHDVDVFIPVNNTVAITDAEFFVASLHFANARK